MLLDIFYSTQEQYKPNLRRFWWLYGFAFSAPVFVSFLQLSGNYPYYSFDMVGDQWVGRVSGGYFKPNNFIAFLTPLYLATFYLILYKRRRILGYFLMLLIFAFLIVTVHRTSLIGYLMILASSVFYRRTAMLIHAYYKYFINFFVGVLFFLSLYVVEQNYGLIEGLRGRIAMWLAHAQYFFSSSFAEIAMGKQEVLLKGKYSTHYLVGSTGEAHNNTLRTIIFFGILGYFLYCATVRYLVMRSYAETNRWEIRFVRMSCFSFLIFYTFTNEPYYFSAILWPALLLILPVLKTDTNNTLA